MEYKEIEDVFKTLYDQKTNNILGVLQELRRRGARPIYCIKLLSNILDISFMEANAIVINSGLWADDVKRSQHFTSEFTDYLDSISKNGE